MSGIYIARCQMCGEVTAGLTKGVCADTEEMQVIYEWINRGRAVSLSVYPVKTRKCQCMNSHIEMERKND